MPAVSPGLQRGGPVLMDGLAFVVGLGVAPPYRSGDELGRLVGLESQIEPALPVGQLLPAQPSIAEHQVVVGLQVFRVHRQDLEELRDRLVVLSFQEENAAGLVSDHSIAGILSQGPSKMGQGLVVFSLGFQRQAVEIMALGQIRIQFQRFSQDLLSPFGVALPHPGPSHVHPPVGKVGIQPGDGQEGLLGGFEVSLQQEADPVVIPTDQVGLVQGGPRLGWVGAPVQNPQFSSVLGHDHDGQCGDLLELA